MRISVFLPLLALAALPAGAKTNVASMEPPMWWTGMETRQLQIMVSGENIRDAVPEIAYPGVRIDSVARLDSPNYQFIYLTVGDDARPGEMEIVFRDGKRTLKKRYELLARDKAGADYEGFDSSDALYLLMPDRFADGDPGNNEVEGLAHPVRPDRSNPSGRHGGDIKGIADHLDYLQRLGVTAVWLTPVLENDMPGGSYHGYATTDYYRVDPRFGTNEEYRAFVAECHKRGIKVVMDMIFNHCGFSHPWIADLPSRDWLNSPVDAEALEAIAGQLEGRKTDTPKGYKQTNFRLNTVHDPYRSDYDYDLTVNGWFVTAMPDLNQRNPHLMTYLIQNSIWWVEYAKVNGIRMDTYPYADMPSMARWNKAVLAEYPNFNIVGESWLADPESIAFMQRGNKLNPVNTELKTVMDFPFFMLAQKAFSEKTLPWADGLNRLYDHLALDAVYPDPSNVLTFLDNHDTDRFLPSVPSDLARWKQAQTFLLTSRGIPQIYYGTELLMSGTKARSDGDIRLDMPGGFPGDSVDAFQEAGRTPLQREAFDFMSRLLHWRQGNTAVAEGATRHFLPTNGLYVYERRSADRRVIVVLNGTDEELADVDMSRYAEIVAPGTVLRDALTERTVVWEERMTFPARASLVLE